MVMESNCTMNNKMIFRNLMLFLMLMLNAFAHAQDVYVKLSIKEDKAEHFLPIAVDGDSIPFLYVEYENGTDSSIYLHRIGISSENDFPLLPIVGIYSYLKNPPNLYELAIVSKGKNKGHEFTVQIQSIFNVMTKDHRIETEWIINVYRFLANIRYGIVVNNNSYSDCYGWEENDFSPESVCYYEKHKEYMGFSLPIDSMMLLERYRKNLVFLPPHSKVVHRYNLIGFWYVGGDYLFKLPDDYQSPRSVYDKTFRHLLNLPESIDGFRLYEGAFKSNEVMLKEKNPTGTE